MIDGRTAELLKIDWGKKQWGRPARGFSDLGSPHLTLPLCLAE